MIELECYRLKQPNLPWARLSLAVSFKETKPIIVTGRALSPCASSSRVVWCPVEAAGDGIMTTQRVELPQGTLDLLILRILALGAQHGWAISERLQQISNDALRVQQGSLYPALHRLERRGWIKAKWGASDHNRRAKYYELTRAGQKQLATETATWQQLTAVVARVLDSV
jgi:PadR family transcriptional regulator, regulatory protein PadR